MKTLNNFITEKLKLGKNTQINNDYFELKITEDYPKYLKSTLSSIISLIKDNFKQNFKVEINKKIIEIKKCSIQYDSVFKEFLILFYANNDDEKWTFACFSEREISLFVKLNQEYLNTYNSSNNKPTISLVKIIK